MTEGKIIPVAIEEEVKESYLNYAMSVIVSRALPDVRDGLKPVHRRILYSMSEMGLRHDRPKKKCGRIVGDVLGKFHPHSDQSIYDALVRLAQTFSLRLPLVEGQGNFGSIDGDPPAAMRYTEARLASVSEAMLQDLKKDTVDFIPNYDGSMEEPQILPTAFPHLLVNGGSGIAVGMATNLPPHNLREISQALCALIDNKNLSDREVLSYVKGPDFPTAGIIRGVSGIHEALVTGKGKIVVQARHEIEELPGDREAIVVTELPYQVNKANLIVHIAQLVRDKKIEGIADLNDESDKEGMRIVIKLKRAASAQVVLNRLFAHAPLQSNFNVNNLVLVNGIPQLCSLRKLLELFIDHRQEVITRRTRFDLEKARERLHLLEGLIIAIENIDEVVAIIKSSSNAEEAKGRLEKRFDLSEKQAKAILEMRLQRLTNLETEKVFQEIKEKRELIAYLEGLLSDHTKLMGVIKEETQKIAEKFGDERRTEIMHSDAEDVTIEDLIEREDVVILLSRRGYINRIPISAYREQHRGGKGANSGRLREGDFLEKIFITSTHHYILFITTHGRAFWLKSYEIPGGSRESQGRHVRSLFLLNEGEMVSEITPLKAFTQEETLLMATEMGVVKRVATYDFRNARQRGIVAISLEEGDRLISAQLTDGHRNVVLISRQGKGLKLHETSIRTMGRGARGVRGLRLGKEDRLEGVCCEQPGERMFLVGEKGFGKLLSYDQLSPHGRGTGGQKVYNITEKTGFLAGILSVREADTIVGISSKGKAIRVGLHAVPTLGRITSGVKVLNTEEDTLVGVARLQKEPFEEDAQP